MTRLNEKYKNQRFILLKQKLFVHTEINFDIYCVHKIVNI